MAAWRAPADRTSRMRRRHLLLVAIAALGLVHGTLAAERPPATPSPGPATPAAVGPCAGAADWWATTATAFDATAALYRRNAAAWTIGRPGPDDPAMVRATVAGFRQAQEAASVPAAGADLHRSTLDFLDAVLALIDLVGAPGDPGALHVARLTLVENIAPMMLTRPGEAAFLATCQPVDRADRGGDAWPAHRTLPAGPMGGGDDPSPGAPVASGPGGVS